MAAGRRCPARAAEIRRCDLHARVGGRTANRRHPGRHQRSRCGLGPDRQARPDGRHYLSGRHNLSAPRHDLGGSDRAARAADGTPVVISGGDDSTIRVWRLDDGTPVGKPAHGHVGAVRAVTAGQLPDGIPVVVSGGDDGTIRVWRLDDGTPSGAPLDVSPGEIRAVAGGQLADGTPVIVSLSVADDEDYDHRQYEEHNGRRKVRVWLGTTAPRSGEPLPGRHQWGYAVAGTQVIYPRYPYHRQR